MAWAVLSLAASRILSDMTARALGVYDRRTAEGGPRACIGNAGSEELWQAGQVAVCGTEVPGPGYAISPDSLSSAISCLAKPASVNTLSVSCPYVGA